MKKAAPRTGFDDLMTVAECAVMYRKTPKTIRGWIRKKILPATRTPSGDYLIRREDAIRILRDRWVR